jgi:threonine dehydratase
MPKFKVTATMDVGYEAVVTARNEDEAWQMANDDVATIEWVQTDEGHDWTLENVCEADDDEA